MTKRLAPLALLFGMLTAMMLGSTAMAYATPSATATSGTTTCTNTSTTNVVNCVLNNVTVTIKGNRVLTAEELVKLQNVLNNVTVNVDPVIYIKDIKIAVLNVYNNTFNIPITVGDINVCVLSLCK